MGMHAVERKPEAAGPVGFLAAERQDGGLYVAEVDVAITHQRQGIGRRLMQTAIDCARNEGLANLTLTTRLDIPWNAPFYRALGFLVLDEDALPPHLAAARQRDGGRPAGPLRHAPLPASASLKVHFPARRPSPLPTQSGLSRGAHRAPAPKAGPG